MLFNSDIPWDTIIHKTLGLHNSFKNKVNDSDTRFLFKTKVEDYLKDEYDFYDLTVKCDQENNPSGLVDWKFLALRISIKDTPIPIVEQIDIKPNELGQLQVDFRLVTL